MTITLIGYRGSGKSTVGAQLAARLNWDFVDSDTLIEQRAGKSIAEIFRDDGEPHFRFLEAGVLAELLTQPHMVIGAGGGAILDSQTRAAMRLAGPVIWLQASASELLARIQADASSAQRRPALTDQDQQTEVEQVLAIRQPLYAEAATMTVSVENRTVAAIVDEIVSRS
ncbi:MAG: shikimate kinase [Planctomycetaceae bacterium]|nr:shikimate kinase [Planctomycetaceae bacterium]